MTGGGIHRAKADFSGTDVRDAVADAFSAVREADDKLTYKALGRVVVKSADQAECYAKGEAEIGSVALLRSIREWGSRFADPILALAGYRLCALAPTDRNDRTAPRRLTALLMGVSVALENDDVIDDAELLLNAAGIDDAGALIDELRHRLAGLRRRTA